MVLNRLILGPLPLPAEPGSEKGMQCRSSTSREQIEAGPDGVSLDSGVRRGDFFKNPAGNPVNLRAHLHARAAFEAAIQVEPRRIQMTPFAAGAQ